MAVIREDRKFGIQPIGVVKASRGGEIVANAVTRSAEQIGQMAYKAGARQAEKRGTEEAMAASKETIIGFDPETGNPTALNELSKMGTIRADAYERIVLRRFEQSMEEELRNKSSEIAMQNQSESAYNDLFSTYIAGMAENATGLYKEYITNTGSVIQGRTALALREQAIRRAQAQAKAEADANQARAESIALTNAIAGGEANFEPLIQISTQSGQDVAEFTGQPFNLTDAEQKIRYNDAYGYSMGRLGDLTATERTSYLAWLRSGGTYVEPVSDNVQKLQARALNAFGADAAKLIELSGDISSSVTAWNGMEGPADRAAAAASNAFNTANLELNASLESQTPLNTARSDFNAGLDLVDQYSDFNIGELTRGGDNTGAVGTRITAVGNLRGQVSSGIISKMLDEIGPTVEELQDFKNQLQSGNATGLISAYQAKTTLDDTTASRISTLLGATDPAEYTTQLDDEVQFLEMKQERATAAADAIFTELDYEKLNGEVLDGTMSVEDALAIVPAASSLADKAQVEFRDSEQIRNLSIAINKMGVTSSDLSDELSRAAISLADFNDTNYPLIFANGLNETVRQTYTNMSEQSRRQTVSRMLASMPNADAITVATHSANADQISESISELTTAFGSMESDQIIAEADNIRGRLNENDALESNDRTKLLGELNIQVAEVVLGRELSGLTESMARQVAYYIGSDVTDENIISTLGNELGQKIVDGLRGLDVGQRETLQSRLVDNINGKIRADEVTRESDRINGVIRQATGSGSGPIIGLQDGDIDAIVDTILLNNGITNQFGGPDRSQIPPDIFTNYSYWVGESADPKMRQLATDLTGLARRGIVHPQLADALRGVAQGMYGQEPSENLLNIYAGVSSSLDPSTALAVRNVISQESGLSAEDIGVLDAMSRLRSANVGWNVFSSLAGPSTAETRAATRSNFEATYGVSPEQLAKDAANKGLFTMSVWENNPSLHQTWTDYIIGVASLNRNISKSTLEQMASQFIKSNFVEDSFVTRLGSPADRLTNIPYRASFASEDASTVATMLVQFEAFEAYGRQVQPNASRAEQVAIGRQHYTRTSSLVGPRGKNLQMDYRLESYELINGDFDLRGRTAFTFVLPEYANPSDPVFYLSSMDQAGGINVLNVNPVRVNDPRYQRGIAVLESVRQTDSDNYAAAAWDAMTEFYLGAN